MESTILTPNQQKTTLPKMGQVPRSWYVLNAKDQPLGRIASRAAKILLGKIKPIYSHAVDCGDFVVITNASQVKLTGNKLEAKEYFYHTKHPGGGKHVPYKKMMAERPEKALELAVKRMLPKNRLASRQILRLKIYRDNRHPHIAQNPQPIENKKI